MRLPFPPAASRKITVRATLRRRRSWPRALCALRENCHDRAPAHSPPPYTGGCLCGAVRYR